MGNYIPLLFISYTYILASHHHHAFIVVFTKLLSIQNGTTKLMIRCASCTGFPLTSVLISYNLPSLHQSLNQPQLVVLSSTNQQAFPTKFR